MTVADEKGHPRAGVIGWPIGHSLSPSIHGFWLDKYRLSGQYVAVGIEPDKFESEFPALRDRGFAGVNVTIPFKEKALAHATEITPAARDTGAANTLTFRENGAIHADNTDVAGFMRHVKASAPDWRGPDGPAIIFGAGGAARAIVWALLAENVPKIFIINRTLARTESLCSHFGTNLEAASRNDLERIGKDATLIVNTTSLGMTGQPELDVEFTPSMRSAIAVDIVYNPLKTRFLQCAERNGNRIVTGLGMLLHQAAPGFERWFGVAPEVDDELHETVLRQLLP